MGARATPRVRLLYYMPLFCFSILDCDNPVCFWSWGIDAVVGRQRTKGTVADRHCKVWTCRRTVVCFVPC